jgi:hypothetical protein
MTYKEFRQLCETAEHEPPEPSQLQALGEVIEEMLKRRDREKLTVDLHRPRNA